MTGVIDSHVHAGPELFLRSGDAVDFARAARDKGMAAMVFKCHHEPTVTKAYFAQKQVPGIQLFGGIAMNGFVGGINPLAVGAALEQGAKIVWGPTMHAAHHVEHVGAGTYGVPNLKLPPHLGLRPGIKAIDDDGKLLPEMREVIALAKRYDATIATAHFGDAEVRQIATVCAEEGVRCVLTHVFFLDQQATFCEEMAALGAYLEISTAAANPLERFMFRCHGDGMRLDQARDLIAKVGRDRVVLSSDLGQDYNPPPVPAFEAFLSQLVSVGVPEADVRHMATVTPRRILGLER
ncbi:DUF6282 family protein [Pseudonocardia pini]|uniref:DUF6282 family protein n=1 Tax=Pseudonocardia pini TaxID=2758030 RepID=UPI0015F0713A|nr:DUF6282 family protein [Pseudonocardia pini]